MAETLRSRRKRESRERIVDEAARLFKKHGYAATGIDAVMEAAGLTAGGFYGHFDSKDELLRECLRTSVAKQWRRLTGGLSGSPRERLKQFGTRYLSTQHRDSEEEGCILAGLAAELSRQGRPTSKAVADYVEGWIVELEKLGASRAQAMKAVSSFVGALLLSRLVRGHKLSDELLETVRG